MRIVLSSGYMPWTIVYPIIEPVYNVNLHKHVGIIFLRIYTKNHENNK